MNYGTKSFALHFNIFLYAITTVDCELRNEITQIPDEYIGH